MIIKSMGRRKTTARNGQSVFASLLNYFLKEKGAKIDICHNIPSHYYPSEIIDTFADNARYLHERKNGNLAYHEIISFPVTQHDRSKVNTALQNIGRTYLAERAPQNIAVGVIHNDKDHVHLHLMLSSNKLYERNRVRLSKDDFLAIQERLAAKAQSLYPEFGLENLYTPDNIRSNARGSVRLTQGQQQQKVHRKNAPLSRKEQLSQLIQELLNKHQDKTTLEAALGQHGFTLYQRGQTVGLVDQDGKKYRLSTLGIMPSYQAWQQKIQDSVSQKETSKVKVPVAKRDLKAEAKQNIARFTAEENQRKHKETTNKVEIESQRRLRELQRAKAFQVAKEHLEILKQTPPTQEPKAPPIPPVKVDLQAQAQRRIAELEQAEKARQLKEKAQANIEAMQLAQAQKEQQERAEQIRLKAQQEKEALEQAQKDKEEAEVRARMVKAQAEAQAKKDQQHTPTLNQAPKRDLKAEAEKRIVELEQEYLAKQSTRNTHNVQAARQPTSPQKTPESPDFSPNVQNVLDSMRRRTETIQQQSENVKQQDVSRRVNELEQARDKGRDQERDAER